MNKSILSVLNISKNIFKWSIKKVRKNIEIYCPDRQYILIKLFHSDSILSDTIQGCFFTKKKVIKKFGKFRKGEKSYSIKYTFNSEEWSLISVYLNKYVTKKGLKVIDGSYPHEKLHVWVKYDTSDKSFYGIPKSSNIFVFFKRFAVASLKNKFYKHQSSDDLNITNSRRLSSTEAYRQDKRDSDSLEDVDISESN